MRTVICLLILMILVSPGCSQNGPPRYAVSGTVAFQGEPLKEGAIQFEPMEAGKGQAGGAPILDGAFQIPAENGLLAGKYRVLIYSGTTGVAPTEPPRPGVPIAAERIPARYNAQSTLTKEVGPESQNKLEFNLE